jgi:hypothetical protein
VPNAVGVSLARNRRSPKRPSEPRRSGVHPEEDAVEKRQRSFPLENDEWNGFGKFLVRHKSGTLRKILVSIPLAVTRDYISAVSGSPYFAH